MSENAAVLKLPATRDGSKSGEPVPSRTFAWAAGLMFLGTVTFAWIYVQGNYSLSAPPSAGWLAVEQTRTELVARFNKILWHALWVSVVSGIAGLAFLSFGLVRWRRAWKNSLEDLRDQSLQWRAKATSIERLLGDTRDLVENSSKSESKARTELEELSQKHAQLQAELDKRKQSEKTLSAQRQSLESSKTVLEMHVQARTVELQKMQRRYELILNSAGEGICGFDLDGKATFVNPAVARMTGWKIEELLGRTADELFRPQGKGEDSGEQIFHRQDQQPFVVEFVRTRIEEEGRRTGSVLIFKDITERKRSEETLEQKAAELTRSNAELEQFAFVASHDLQEPLRKIQAFGDRLKMKCEATMARDARDYLDRMQKASARMRTLIDDLLAFSRVIRSGEPFAQVDLSQVAREVVGDLELRLEKTGGRVEIGDLPTIDADPTQMRQLFLNLIGNALKFQAPGTQPLVKLHSSGFTSGSGELFWEIKVKDNGIGFDEQYTEKIFAVFQRLHGRDEFEGTGIGLAVCRRITDRHGGQIVAKSKPGKGATFIVTLPARQSR